MLSTTLSPAADAAISSNRALRQVPFFGRSLADYESLFGFDARTYIHRSVLDVGAGSASFTAEAVRLGVRARAVDPVYRYRFPAVRDRALRDFRAVRALVRASRVRYALPTPEAEAALWERRQAACDAFLADFPSGVPAGRYRAGALPRLEFPHASFDLVLCGHLLFLHREQLSEAFHREALLELVRVARERVVIYPLVDLGGLPYPALDRLRQELASAGVTSRLQFVSPVTLKSADQRLLLFPPP